MNSTKTCYASIIGILSALALNGCDSLIIDFRYPQYQWVVKSSVVRLDFNVLGASGQVTSTCALDGGTPVACVSGDRLKVATGPHTIRVTATDAAGKTGAGDVQFSVEKATFEITSPTPSEVVRASTTPIDFVTTDLSTTLAPRCQIDNGPSYACSGLHRSAQLSSGLHTLRVTTVDPPFADQVTFLVDPSSGYRRIAARQIDAGGFHTCAITGAGKVRCWGYSDSGQLGYGNTNTIGDDEVPAQVSDVNVGGIVTQISAGERHTCALLSTGKVRCWGRNEYGQLGYGTSANVGDDEVPASIGDVDLGEAAVQVSAGGYHSCALLASGRVRCWGRNDYGQLGYGHTRSIGDDELPASVSTVSVGAEVTRIEAGGLHTCALQANGLLRCWGQNGSGQLGTYDGLSIGDDELPSSVAPPLTFPINVVQVSTGAQQTCMTTSSGDPYCYGGSLSYYYTLRSILGPVTAINSGGSFSRLPGEPSGGYYTSEHACALRVDGNIRCLGPLGSVDSNVGAVALGTASNAVSSGGIHACALTESGGIRCFGYPDARLGYGTVRSASPAAPIPNEVILGLQLVGDVIP